jgi:hypothetical protein
MQYQYKSEDDSAILQHFPMKVQFLYLQRSLHEQDSVLYWHEVLHLRLVFIFLVVQDHEQIQLLEIFQMIYLNLLNFFLSIELHRRKSDS